MSMPAAPGAPPPATGQGSSGGTDIVTSLQGIIRQLSNANANTLTLISAIQSVFPRITGSFTLAAAATTTVTQPEITATSVVLPFPTNAAAATLMGSAKALYIKTLTPGASFTVETANAANAVGSETFSYIVANTG